MTTTTPTLPFERPDSMAPPPAYARLRDATPVAEVFARDGRRAWLVTSFDAVSAVLGDRRFGIMPPGESVPGNDSLFQDGEAHARLRRLVSKAFSARKIAEMGPRIERLADEQITVLTETGPPADLVDGFAAPLSIMVIGELLGVSIEDRPRFRRLAEAAGSVDFFFGAEEDVAVAAQAWQGLGEYAAELIAAKRQAPADDLLGTLIEVRDAEDGRLTDTELIALVGTIVNGGYLSACNAVAVGVLRLLSEGKPADLAGADSEQADAIVAEVLRMQAGMTGEPFPRYAHEEVEVAGVSIAKGDLVLVRLEAAHRDPARFTDPDRFAPGRPGPSLVFGHGLHYCLGANLARMEVVAALRALARHLPGLRLQVPVDAIEWTHDAFDIGPKALPVTW
ncbi:cytochrome P450 [Rhizohabitans arisaemae]|uniref:cytochrome P450 n=1 Tax=Rhizohabitans arisaemae TaxID=2720610 RepID=UPI0024B0BE43|nr:cytochrome P450 [Rhizohabitans arisaemae]